MRIGVAILGALLCPILALGSPDTKEKEEIQTKLGWVFSGLYDAYPEIYQQYVLGYSQHLEGLKLNCDSLGKMSASKSRNSFKVEPATKQRIYEISRRDLANAYQRIEFIEARLKMAKTDIDREMEKLGSWSLQHINDFAILGAANASIHMYADVKLKAIEDAVKKGQFDQCSTLVSDVSALYKKVVR